MNEECCHKSTCERWQILRVILSAFLLIASLVFDLTGSVRFIICIAAYLTVGADVIFHSVSGIFAMRLPDENFLMSVASVCAFAIGEYAEGVAVMLLFQTGEIFQERAVAHSRRSISALMDICPDYANVLLNGEIVKTDPNDVRIGDTIIIKAGERVPLDAIIVSGSGSIDASALTGESIPRSVFEGSQILSGTINLTGTLTAEVSHDAGTSAVGRILELVENASERKSASETFVRSFAKIYTPIVVILALFIALLPPVFGAVAFADNLPRALMFLVISCPCALVISVPLSYYCGIGSASRRGILVKGSAYMETLSRIDSIVFDKTGTLTKGAFSVSRIAPAPDVSAYELSMLAAYAESHSDHPIAHALTEAYEHAPDISRISDPFEHAGLGVSITLDGAKIYAGNAKLLRSFGIAFEESEKAGASTVYIARDSKYMGCISIEDEIKSDAADSLKKLRSLGITKFAMLTGDNRSSALRVANALGIDEVFSELLPDGKVSKLEAISKESKGLCFVGDGINDAPVLARADIGVAMGALGSDAAIEAADIVIMDDDLSRLPEAISLSMRTRGVVVQNIVLSLLVKALILTIALFGISHSMWLAILADVGVSIIAILNAMRLLRKSRA